MSAVPVLGEQLTDLSIVAAEAVVVKTNEGKKLAISVKNNEVTLNATRGRNLKTCFVMRVDQILRKNSQGNPSTYPVNCFSSLF
jgi:hypothetical protein